MPAPALSARLRLEVLEERVLLTSDAALLDPAHEQTAEQASGSLTDDFSDADAAMLREGPADAAGNTIMALTSAEDTATDTTPPAVTINQAADQSDPVATVGAINFTVVFSEPVTGFDADDVVLGGSALPTNAIVTGSGTTYNVAVFGMTNNGTVSASVKAGAATDAAGNASTASTSTDATVEFILISSDYPGPIIGTDGDDVIRVYWEFPPLHVSHLPPIIRLSFNGVNVVQINPNIALLVIHGRGGNDHIEVQDLDGVGAVGTLPVSVVGGAGDDTLIGGRSGDTLEGGDGNDQVFGRSGDDQVFGEAGNDSMDGGDGNDSLGGGVGDDLMFGSAGSDLMFGEAGNDAMDGGDDNDVMDGGEGNDLLFGSGGNDLIYGGFGNDSIDGGAGDDVIDAGSGNDLAFGSLGNDVIFGGDGNDAIDANDGDDSVDAGAGDDLVFGSGGNDLIFAGLGNDSVDGGLGVDFIDGGPGLNLILN